MYGIGVGIVLIDIFLDRGGRANAPPPLNHRYLCSCAILHTITYDKHFANLYNARLDTDSKNAEILRLLPLMNPLAAEFNNLKKSLDVAFQKLEEVITHHMVP